VDRRRFLNLSAAGAAAAATGGLMLRRGRAEVFGEFPAGANVALLPADRRAESVLEIFLYGGLSPWETLYLVEEYGTPADPDFPDQQFYTFGGAGPDSVETALSACAFPDGEPMGQFFATDANGADVKLGPFAHRLRQRGDLVDRMRLLVQHHRLEPHEAAVPQALTGKPVGQPSAAGLGAHVQRFAAERAAAGRTAPHSYLFATGGVAGDNVSAGAATGVHPGIARPLQVTITNVDDFADLLARGAIPDRAGYDDLTDIYVDQYRERLRWQGRGAPVRSAHFTDLELAAATVRGVDAIAEVMDRSLFEPIAGLACGDSRDDDIPGMSLNAARHLLTHPEQPASYVAVSDIGLFEASGGGGYDTHTTNSFDTARNFDNLLRGLAAIVNQPGENDPTKLDLDRTMIILNTEFGRTPVAQDGGSGRNHHPYGYVTALIGGPIRERGVVGAIGPDGNAGSSYVTPAENRIAALLALGIWPFSPEAFAVSDVQRAASEAGGAVDVIERVLGVGA
jgi:hypothetical protein